MSPYYKYRARRNRDLYNKTAKLRAATQDAILSKLGFQDGLYVLNGPFKGMRYTNQSYCGELLPKILGSYEEPIQPWVNKILTESRYEKIIDVGCAEGYYAVGLALKMPTTSVYAFDIDVSALAEARELAILNGVKNIKFDSSCTHETLEGLIGDNALVFCDIEGAEDELLDPQMAPALRDADIIVESHDCFRPGITDRLVDRFYKSHSITIVIDSGSREKPYFLPEHSKITPDELEYMKNEIRAEQMRYIMMKNRHG